MSTQVVRSTGSVVPGPGARATATATCPAGTLALGGGAEVTAQALQQVAVTQSMPVGSPATQWTVQAQQNSAGNGAWTVTAHVICTVP
ncbi:hypothetical protein [Cellulomonas sp. Marseille-Q8402]